MTATRSEIEAVLVSLPLFSAVSAEQISTLAATSRMIRLQKSQLLFQSGDKPNGFFCVIEGRIKLAVSSTQGNEKVVDIVGPRQTFGEALMFMEQSAYPVFAEALTKSCVLQVPSQAVFEQLEQDRTFARKMLAGMSGRLHMMVRDVKSYALHNATQRVVGYLLQDPQIEPDATQQQMLYLDMSKQIIASRLNLAPETLSRIFYTLAEAGLISIEGKRICLLDLPRLREYGEQ